MLNRRFKGFKKESRFIFSSMLTWGGIHLSLLIIWDAMVLLSLGTLKMLEECFLGKHFNYSA